jgi:predicted DNA-binding mobile mystery protein A
MKSQLLGRRLLDRRLALWRDLPGAARARPQGGWIRAIREALGMSASDLASRMGVTHAAVAKFEASEQRGRIGLDTLERVADSMGCDVVYALVPRVSLTQMVHDQAERVARREFDRVGNSMRLEAQGLDPVDSGEAFDDLVQAVENERGLWRPHRD